jgi:flavorubredoxin
MPKALVVYATRTQKTKEIAHQIAEGIKAAGAEVTVVDSKSIRCTTELEGYDGYAFGSATYHGEMMEAMKTLLFMAEKANLDGKIGGAFGSYGWSGEAPDRIYQTMKNVFNMKMVKDPLRIKSPATPGDAQSAHTYGQEIGQKINP